MSVINKMLRDLDRRQALGALGATLPVQGPMANGPFTGSTPARARRLGSWGLVGLTGLALVGFLAWNLLVPQTPPAVTAAATAAAAPAAPVGAPPLQAADSVVALRLDTELSARHLQEALNRPARSDRMAVAVGSRPVSAGALPVLAAAAKPNVPPASAAQGPVTVAASAPQLTVPERVRRQPAEVVAPGLVQRQSAAVQEALAQAQQLWAQGAREAAFALLRQALEATERSAHGAMAGEHGALMTVLLRESCRMLQELGRYGAMRDLLVAYDPWVARQPDLLALRAHAAQRQGQHAESVQDYLAALEFRPAEQRWILGVAVSLAALGQKPSALAMLTRAQALGPIPGEIQAYMDQAGIGH